MKQITLDEALERQKNFQALDDAVENLKRLDNVGSVEKSRTLVMKSVAFDEAIRLVQQDKLVYYRFDHKGSGQSGWTKLTKESTLPLSYLMKSEFKVEIQARSISFTMTQRHPIASKRNAFEFQNEALDISIYGKKGTLPNSGKGIRVQITEIL